MAEKKGICKNYVNCSLADKEEEQIVDEINFVCDECHQPLEEVSEKGTRSNIDQNKKRLLIIILAAVIIIAGVIVAITMFGGHEPTLLTLNKTQGELTIGECDTIVARVTPIDDKLEVLFQSSNEDVAMVSSTGVVRAIAEGTTTITAIVLPRKGDTVSASCVFTVMPAIVVADMVAIDTVAIDTVAIDTVEAAPVQPQPRQPKRQTSNRLSLSYGVYEGDLQGGQPHGNGTMYFKQRQIIPGTVDCEASSGERVIGTWRDGKINMGTWYRSDGNQVIVKLGQRYNK